MVLTSVVLLWLSFTLTGAHSLSGYLPPPENISLSWATNSLSVEVYWKEPAGLDKKCKVNYTVSVYYEKCPPQETTFKGSKRIENLHVTCTVPKEAEICVGITTNPMDCKNRIASKEVYKHLSPPLELVKDFKCEYYDKNKMNCTWTIVKNTPNLQLFYRNIDTEEKSLRPCTLYDTEETMKKGCHLNDKTLTPAVDIYFVFNGTRGNDWIKNQFVQKIRETVKLPKPNVSIEQKDGRLRFNASIPNFLAPHCLKYKYIYSNCDEKREVEGDETSSAYVEYDTACKYTVQGQVIYTNNCVGNKDVKSDMSELQYFGKDGVPDLAFYVAMIITPLIVLCCLVAAIVLFRRNKDIILPKIPEPSLFFKDMLNTTDGFSKSLGGVNLYVPYKEVVASGVILEPRNPKEDICI